MLAPNAIDMAALRSGTVDSDNHIRNVSSSHPQLVHHTSRQSIAASDDYYSLTDRSSPAARSPTPNAGLGYGLSQANYTPTASRQTITRYMTPPSRTISAGQVSLESMASHGSHASRGSHSDVGNLQRESLAVHPTTSRSSIETPAPSRPAAPAAASTSASLAPSMPLSASAPTTSHISIPTQVQRRAGPLGMHPPGSPDSNASAIDSLAAVRRAPFGDDRRAENDTPTPGVDDTPYIHFAIDQLTRDEELSRRSRTASIAGNGNLPSSRMAGFRSDSSRLGHYSRANEEQLERVERAGLGCQESGQQQKHQRGDSIGSGASQGSDDRRESSRLLRSDDNDMHAIDPPRDGNRYSPINHVPAILNPFWLGVLFLLILAMIAALIFCVIWGRRHEGLWNWDGLGTRRYFVFDYMPQIIGCLLHLWLQTVQSAVYRIAPLASLARGTSQKKNHMPLHCLSYLPRNFLLPDLSYFAHGEQMVGIVLFIIWAANMFAVPLLSALFVVHHVGPVTAGWFRFTTVEPIAGTLIGLYALAAIALLLVFARFNLQRSGLMWDPVSLADLIPLIQRSNILHMFEQTEISRVVHIPVSGLRLGYWSSARQIFYGIGRESTSDEDAWNDQIGEQQNKQHGEQEKEPERVEDDPTADLEQQRLHIKDSFERDLHSPFVRYRWTPWFLTNIAIIVWIVFAVVLMIALIVVSFARSGIHTGFIPYLGTRPHRDGFSASNFLYRFLPSFLGHLCFQFWQPIDIYFRSVQPFTNLANLSRRNGVRGARADRSLLQSYHAQLPLQATVSALFSKDFKVAVVSTASLAWLVLPILAGGMFTAEFWPSPAPPAAPNGGNDNGGHFTFASLSTVTSDLTLPSAVPGHIRMTPHLPAYYTLLGFAVVHALAYVGMWPRRKRYLPHQLYTYADVFSFLYRSSLLADRVLREPRTKADLVTRLLIAAPGEEGDDGHGEGQHADGMARYGFGVYTGTDGREHLGVDRVRPPGGAEMVFTQPRR